jgi:hypothetical protein
MRCAVHDSKPLNCVLFPEYHQIRSILSTFKTPSIFSEFQCLDGNITISNKRRHALLTLRKMNRIEEAVSCYFLFGTPSFIIDAKPINRELKRNLSQTDTVSPQKYDDFAVKKLKHIGFFNRFMENLAALDAYDGIERIFEICNHGDLVSLLVEQATTQNTIFAFKRDGFKKRKRQLAPRSFTHLIFLLPEFTPLGNRR